MASSRLTDNSPLGSLQLCYQELVGTLTTAELQIASLDEKAASDIISSYQLAASTVLAMSQSNTSPSLTRLNTSSQLMVFVTGAVLAWRSASLLVSFRIFCVTNRRGLAVRVAVGKAEAENRLPLLSEACETVSCTLSWTGYVLRAPRSEAMNSHNPLTKNDDTVGWRRVCASGIVNTAAAI